MIESSTPQHVEEYTTFKLGLKKLLFPYRLSRGRKMADDIGWGRPGLVATRVSCYGRIFGRFVISLYDEYFSRLTLLLFVSRSVYRHSKSNQTAPFQ